MLRTLFVSSFLLAAPAGAQIALGGDATLDVSGGVQPRVSFASQEVGDDRTDTRLGVGLRRARIQFNLAYQDRAGLEYDVDTAPGDVRGVDLFGYYNVSDAVQVRVGRLPVAQPRAYIPTSYTRIDAIDRAVIAERWAGGTIGSSGRDFGAEVEFATGDTELLLSIHNGGGGFDRATDNFRESGSSGSVTRGTDQTALAIGASAHRGGSTGVSFGGYAGYNGAGSDQTAVGTADGDVQRSYATAAAHLYWGERIGSQPVRVKLDAVGIQYEEVGGESQQSVGVSAYGAVRVLGSGEAFVRGEQFWDDVDGPGATYGTVGVSYSASAARGQDYRNVRITAGYTARQDEDDDVAHLVIVQGQIVF